MSDADETKPDLTVGSIFGRPARDLTSEEKATVSALREVLATVSAEAHSALARSHHSVRGTATHAHLEGTRLAYETIGEQLKKRINAIESVTTGGRAR